MWAGARGLYKMENICTSISWQEKRDNCLIFSKFLAIMFAGGAISHDAPTGPSLELSITSRWKTQLELICPMAAP